MTNESETPAAADEGALSFDRNAGLSAEAQRLAGQVVQLIRVERLAEAERGIAALAALTPTHPEVMRLHAVLLHKRKRFAEAVSLLRRALEQAPNDALAWSNLGTALVETGAVDEAIDAFRCSAELEPTRATSWFNLGRALDDRGRVDEAHDALRKAIVADPGHVPAHVSLARVLQFMGRIDEAQAEYRQTLAMVPDSAMAWFGLSTMRTVRFGEDDVRAMERVYARADLRVDDRIAIGFALAKALEDCSRHGESFAVLAAANALKRRNVPWDASALTRHVNAIDRTFASTPKTSAAADQGREVIFVVGMPRSGSTLVEQILAAHPQVAGGAELETLRHLMDEESRRRRTPFPAWVPQARPDDWERLGRRYLERTAEWRTEQAIFTDKGLMNWLHVGALRAMLPGARIVNTRRDPVETCLACFRSSFAKELGFTYDLVDLAAFWQDYDRTIQLWHERCPEAIYDVVHERLIEQPEEEIRRLLSFLDLPFDDACLRFHEVERNIRTASAAQVREPLRKDTARAHFFGTLLNPLRAMIAAAPASATAA